MYTKLAEPQTRVLGGRGGKIGADITLPGLGAVVRTAVIAQFFLKKFTNDNNNVFSTNSIQC